MSIWPDDYDPCTVGVTQSLLGAASMCPVRAALMADRWQPVGLIKTTTFGSLFHYLAEQAYVGSVPPAPEEVDAWIELYREKNSDELELCMSSEEWEWTATKAYHTFVAYAQHYAADWKTKKFTSLEGVRNARFQEWLLRGMLDGVFTAKDGTQWLLETKTMSRIDEDSLWGRVSFDTQCQFYLLLHEMATGKRLKGAIYNVVRNPSYKSVDSLKAALAKDPKHFFIRGQVTFNDKDREAFLEDIEAQLMELEMRVSGCLATYRNTAACDKPYKCGYLTYCASGSTEGLIQRDQIFAELS